MSVQPQEPKSILEQEPPPIEQLVERVRFFAKALAYGSVKSLWPTKFKIGKQEFQGYGWIENWRIEDPQSRFGDCLNTYLRKIWEYRPPDASLLKVFGFLTETNNLTPEAFALLEEPSKIPDVFISYKRTLSSALGLLVVARLQARGIENPYIDMEIPPGDRWHAELESKVRSTQYFISLIAPDTLTSDNVIKEIQWALETAEDNPGYVIIPIWHSGFLTQDGYPDSITDLKKYNAIIVENESAKNYNNAMVELLNRLGYAPR